MNSASAKVLPLAKRLYAPDGAARRWLARSHREKLMTAYSSGFTRAICNSSNCAWVTSQNGFGHFGSPDRIKMLGGNEFRLRQGFAVGKTLVRA